MATLAIQQKVTCDHTIIIEGIITASTSNSISDSKKNWPIDLLRGKKLTIWYGKGIGQVVSVAGNLHSQLFINGEWAIQPDETSLYRLRIPSIVGYCPKCSGSKEYRDISFSGGKRKTLTGISKLAQSLDTMVLSPSGASIFNPDFGSGIQLVLSSDVLDDDEIQMFVEKNVVDSMTFLSIKQNEALSKLNFDNSELFGQLKEITIERRETIPTILDLTISTSSSSEEEVIVTAALNTR